MKNWIRRWLGLPTERATIDLRLGSTTQPRTEQEAKLRVELIEACNGRVLQIGKYKPNPHGPDWSFTLYVVPDDQDLPAAIATALVITN